jgi:hypothetical protein
VTDDLIEFLRARLDEDEVAAKDLGNACRPWTWSMPPDGYPQTVSSDGVPYIICQTFDGPQDPAVTAPFIVHNDPARVLRGVEAKRQLLDLTVQSLPGNCDCEAYGHHTDADTALRLLATEWNTHPDYQEAWRP